ncbi:MAG TPA: 50S ribosomal protein L25/general stress protein Ctc [Spirochaetota bacterium]|nr:50S ribosomal protein L25/general stress protein Ctc [Spirochaetota bacterium]HOM10365.1 50S ribosomal protein L25/general stress protein Ctc [Spirochaetota bacterium]HPP49945.1 50S ribosomal protein L25/general stress protein Ctc [Spirochaetota bacterium]HXK64653.1 50S ribosomal protein L25/general stress protein Ctc [Spirochaetota bacterium]
MEAHVLPVETRTQIGKNANHKLRAQGYIPAVLYSHGESQTIMVQKKNFFKIFKGHISENVLIDLDIKDSKGSPVKAFVKDYQRHPITDEILHVDFFRVTMTEAISTKVPVEISGTSIGVKQGGILEIIEREIEVECLPADLPEKITIDVTNLSIGQSIHVKDIAAPKGVTILSTPETVIVAVLAPHKAAEEVAQPVAEEVQPAEEQQ